MKLLTRTNRIYFLFSLVLYLVTAIVFYWVIKEVIYDEVESRLLVEKRDFESYVHQHSNWTEGYFVENKIEVTPVSNRWPLPEMFKDTLIYNRYTHQSDPFRQLSFFTRIGQKEFKVDIRKSLIQSYTLIEVITLVMVLLLTLLLLCMFVFQQTLSEKLWKPFYETLSRIKVFDIAQEETIHLPHLPIDEFDQLNRVLERMSDKVQQDYRSLKEFTENASHEIQTPLALINARVEQLIQAENLTEKQSYWLEEIYHASRRMSRLHQGLLLLAKIENGQFPELTEVNLTEMAKYKLEELEELTTHRQINVTFYEKGNFCLQLSPVLADILLTNLINNAVKHNQVGGILKIETQANSLQITNSGQPPSGDPTQFFERFKKQATHSDSLGLGLAIVKQICQTYHLQVSYAYQNHLHALTIQFNDSQIE